MRVAEAIELDAQTERGLRALAKGRRVEARVQQRASVILLAAQGWQNKDIADEVKLDRRQVALWRRRFIEGGVQALLQDAARLGRTPSVTLAFESLILSRTLYEQPATATQWSTRSLASDLGLSATTIRRVWQRNGIKPHTQDSSKVSRDPPRLEDTRVDVVGLYMSPLVHALVFSCEEKSPQALNRATAHDHKRHGTSTLLAALNVVNGAVNSRYQERHRHEEWLKFLRLIDRKTPKHMTLHLVIDSDANHRYPKVQTWLVKHPRWVMHATPANGSWLNRVRRFLRNLIEHRVRPDSFTSVVDLQQAMAQYIEQQNKNRKPNPFTWTVSASDIAKVTRAQAARAPPVGR